MVSSANTNQKSRRPGQPGSRLLNLLDNEDFISGIAQRLNSARDLENAQRLDGTDAQATRESIERYAGDAFKNAAAGGTAAVGGADPLNIKPSLTTTTQVAAEDSGTDTVRGLEQVDSPATGGQGSSGRPGSSYVKSTGTDTYYSNLFPREVTETQIFGRGANTLGYRTGGKNPAVKTTYEYLGTPLPPVTGGEGGGGATATANANVNFTPPQQKEEQFLERTLRSFIGDQAGELDTIGARGIGEYMGYYGDKFGGNEEILAKARQEGIKFGPTAAKTLGLNTDADSYRGDQDSTPGAIGLEAVKRMRNQGLSDTAIKQFAQEQGIKYGPKALEALGADPSQAYQAPAAAPAAAPAPSQAAREIAATYQTGPNVPQSSAAGQGIGEVGLEKMAAARGITFAQARDQARSAGMQIGARAAAR